MTKAKGKIFVGNSMKNIVIEKSSNQRLEKARLSELSMILYLGD
jgi:hypothetical protein